MSLCKFLSESIVKDEETYKPIMINMGFTWLGEGRHRNVFLSPNRRFVLKFPKNPAGVKVNASEAKAWRRHHGKPDRKHNDMLYAPCKLIGDNVLMMRAMVKILGSTNACDEGRLRGNLGNEDYYDFEKHSVLPEWANEESLDSVQVGFLSSGKLVAYDFGSYTR